MRQGKIFAPEKISMGVVVENAECLGRAAREAPGSAHPAKRRRGREPGCWGRAPLLFTLQLGVVLAPG